MLNRLFGAKRERARSAAALYGAIVAYARTPAFYAGLGVPDTVSGRFEMLILHAVLVIGRLHEGAEEERAAGQDVFDLFCSDMDRSLRELGVGDLGVPKRMREVGEAFYGRSEAYAEAIGRGDEAGLAAAIGRNILKAAAEDAAARALARYALATAANFDAVPPRALLAPPLPFADPAAFVAEAAA